MSNDFNFNALANDVLDSIFADSNFNNSLDSNKWKKITNKFKPVFKQTNDGIVTKVAIPGFDKSEIKVTISHDYEIKIIAEHEDEIFGKNSFETSFYIDDNLKPREFKLVNGELLMFFDTIEKEKTQEFKIS